MFGWWRSCAGGGTSVSPGLGRLGRAGGNLWGAASEGRTAEIEVRVLVGGA